MHQGGCLSHTPPLAHDLLLILAADAAQIECAITPPQLPWPHGAWGRAVKGRDQGTYLYKLACLARQAIGALHVLCACVPGLSTS